jgi:hypothetical protein
MVRVQSPGIGFWIFRAISQAADRAPNRAVHPVEVNEFTTDKVTLEMV